ncbi:MAG: phosphatase PAP2 family protein, partial [Clostridia bacterium]
MHSIISAAIGHTWYLPFEIDFILWLQSGVGTGFGDFLTKVMNVISMFGEEYILVAILGLLFWGLDKHIGENVGFTILTANIFNPLIKNIFCRTRPFDVVGSGVENLRDVDGYSFPSGHSTAAGALYPSLAINYKEKKWKWLVAIAIAVPLLVAFSRMYLGAHFLSDVVVGLALGVGTIFLLQLMHKLISNKYVVYLIVLIVSSVGMFYCTTTDYYTSYGMILGFVCAIAFEQKVCKFENTKVWWRVILRVIIGAAIFLGLNELIKLP